MCREVCCQGDGIVKLSQVRQTSYGRFLLTLLSTASKDPEPVSASNLNSKHQAQTLPLSTKPTHCPPPPTQFRKEPHTRTALQAQTASKGWEKICTSTATRAVVRKVFRVDVLITFPQTDMKAKTGPTKTTVHLRQGYIC